MLSLRPISKSFVARYSSQSWHTQLVSALGEQASQSPSPLAVEGINRKKWKPFLPHTIVRPHDLSYKARSNDPQQFRRRAAVPPPSSIARYNDVFHQFNIDPLSQALNPEILHPFMSEMGKVYGRNVTGLTSRSQRKLGKAIRRAKMMGVISVLSNPAASTYSAHSKR